MWVIDSGCSAHISPHREWFKTFHEFCTPTNTRLGNGDAIEAIGAGTIAIKQGNLLNSHLLPELAANLFSVSAALDNKLACSATDKSINFYLNDERVLEGWHVYNAPGYYCTRTRSANGHEA